MVEKLEGETVFCTGDDVKLPEKYSEQNGIVECKVGMVEAVINMEKKRAWTDGYRAAKGFDSVNVVFRKHGDRVKNSSVNWSEECTMYDLI